jgi:DNA repair exonuclease SbcCD nuclease subunit
MSVLTIGDPHFMLANLDETREYTKKIVSIIKDKNPDIVVVLGDLFHTHEKKHILVEREVTVFLSNLVKYATVYLIVGNHDMINSQQFLTKNHAFTPYRKWDNLIVCDRPKEATINDKKYIFVPFVPPGRFFDALNEIEDWKSADCIFAHQEIYGCKFNPTMVSEHGDKWSSKYPMLISGHIHEEQWVKKNVYYPGSSMQHGFAETQDKIIALAEFKEKIPNIERFTLGLRRKRVVYIDIKDLEKIESELDTSDNIKLVIKGTPEEIKTVRKRKDYHDLVGKVKVSFIPKEIQIDRNIQKKSVIQILKELVTDEPDNVKDALEILLN